MARATICISGCSIDQDGQGAVVFSLGVDTGLNIGGFMNVTLSHSVTQIANDIKDEAIAQIISQGGPSLVRNDVILFGGPV